MISKEWHRALSEAQLPPGLLLMAGAILVACEWLQTEGVLRTEETEHTLIARLKQGLRC